MKIALLLLPLLIVINRSAANTVVLADFQQQALDQHNYLRSLYCIQSLQLNSTLNNIAQSYAAYLAANNVFNHSGAPGLGENLWAELSTGAISFVNGATPTTTWYNEIVYYNYSSPGNTSSTTSFTQIIWKVSTQLGIGIAFTNDSKGAYVAANYFPAGNVQSTFQDNVLPLCSAATVPTTIPTTVPTTTQKQPTTIPTTVPTTTQKQPTTIPTTVPTTTQKQTTAIPTTVPTTTQKQTTTIPTTVPTIVPTTNQKQTTANPTTVPITTQKQTTTIPTTVPTTNQKQTTTIPTTVPTTTQKQTTTIPTTVPITTQKQTTTNPTTAPATTQKQTTTIPTTVPITTQKQTRTNPTTAPATTQKQTTTIPTTVPITTQKQTRTNPTTAPATTQKQTTTIPTTVPTTNQKQTTTNPTTAPATTQKQTTTVPITTQKQTTTNPTTVPTTTQKQTTTIPTTVPITTQKQTTTNPTTVSTTTQKQTTTMVPTTIGGETTALGPDDNSTNSSIITEENFACAFNTIDGRTRADRLNGLRNSGWAPSNNNEAAVFLAQVFHETDGLKTLTEYCAPGCGPDYAASWCSIQGTPGQLYYGRGWFQLSWPCNYYAAGQSLGIDLLDNPSIVEQQQDVAVKTAIWFYNANNMTGPAKEGDFASTTQIINGNLECNGGPGYANQLVRVATYERIRYCFNLGEPTINPIC